VSAENEDFPVPLTSGYLRDLLASTTDLGELKAVLYVSLLSRVTAGSLVDLSLLLAPDVARVIAGTGTPQPSERRVRHALDRAVVNGVLLQLRRGTGEAERVQYLLATEENRDLLKRLARNDESAAAVLDISSHEEVEMYRPNIFALYERLLGPLTPLMAEELRDAERSYSREWIETAMHEAASYNRRTWRYVQSILQRWESEGAPKSMRGRK
jgi:DnaD/phage-associated family protein